MAVTINITSSRGRDGFAMIRALWKVNRLDVTWPGVRVRAMTPALLLRHAGFETVVTSRPPTDGTAHDVVIISKSFSDDDMRLAARTKELGKALVIDLCDDIFGDDRDLANAEAFRNQAALADIVTTTGEILRDAIARQIGGDGKITIVPDHAETLSLTRDLVRAFPPNTKQQIRVFGARPLRRAWRKLIGRERALDPRRKTVVWFGMAGLPGQGTGIEALAAIAPDLNAISNEIPLQLLIVSSAHGRAARAARAFKFPWAFRDWSLLSVHEHISGADVCVIPNPPTAYAVAKSSNRALLSLSAGTPVVASASAAYAPFGDSIVIDDWQGGLRRYLREPHAGAADIAHAREIIDREFAPRVIADHWARVLTRAVTRQVR